MSTKDIQAIKESIEKRIQKDMKEAEKRKKAEQRAVKAEKKAIQYREQVVAFIDILGFSALIKKAQSDNKKAKETIYSLSKAIETSVERNLDSKLTPEDVKEAYDPVYRIFSDCICISSDCIYTVAPQHIASHIFFFLLNIMYVQAELILQDVFIRGGITINKHFENDKMIFSSGLVDSYALESKKAIFPRILIDDSVVGVLRSIDHEGNYPLLNALIKKDADGLVFLDYLEYISECDDMYDRYKYMKLHKEAVEKNLKASSSPEVKQKYLWVARYHNQKVRERFKGDKELLIDKAVLQYDSSVFSPKFYGFSFTSKNEAINNGIILSPGKDKWKAADKVKAYIRKNAKDYMYEIGSSKMIFDTVNRDKISSMLKKENKDIDSILFID